MHHNLSLDLTHVQTSMRHLRETEATWVPFLFTEVFGGRVHVLESVPASGNFGVHDLLLIAEATDDELFRLNRRTSAAIYLPRVSEFADGVLTNADYVGFEALDLMLTKIDPSIQNLDAYFSHAVKVPASRSASKRPAVFLDRDGTIIDLVPYVKDPELVRLMDGVVDFMKRAVAKGYLLVCVTNQSGLGRGYYNLAEFQAVQEKMYELLAAEGLILDGSFFAGYYAESEELLWAGRPGVRKPRPGMLLEAASKLSLNIEESLMIGDSLVDMQVAGAAGVKAAYQILGDARVATSHYGCPGKRVESFGDITL